MSTLCSGEHKLHVIRPVTFHQPYSIDKNISISRLIKNINHSVGLSWTCFLLALFFLQSDRLAFLTSISCNGQFRNSQSWSFIKYMINFNPVDLGYDCLVTIWCSKIQKKAYFLFVINIITQTKEYYRNWKRLKIYGTAQCSGCHAS